MELYNTLTDLLADARSKDRSIRFIDGENDESTVSFAGLWDRAVAMLGSLQARGMRPGDELVIFSKSNESFVIAFWAAVLGGMVPVPVAVGISDEHRLKLFRILSQLQRA
ncbi:MAG: NrsF, partial [Chromatiales bacterium]